MKAFSALVLGLLLAVAGCASSRTHVAAPLSHIAIAADKPPSPATWPKYPHFSSQRSCVGRPVPSGNRPGEQQYAPSYAPALRTLRTPPAEIARRFLARFGDRRYIHSITFPGYMNGTPPSTYELGAIFHPAHVNTASGDASITPTEILRNGIAGWEASVAFGALRDDFCAAGGPSLTSASLVGSIDGAGGVADELDALGQRFANPSPAAFRRRVALVGKRFGFRVVSLRLLRPEQLAPLLVVKTNRDRREFVRDVPTIERLLDPTSSSGHRTASTFEGFYFAAEDAKGPFVSTEQVLRGEVEGGQWPASDNLYPYAHG
ncbi:MAG TPA: hypothetical protein VGH79_07015 [Gaiellaceae bacterium]|jgi:hypothetical protein